MSHARRKKEIATFILLIPKYSKIRNLDKIDKRISKSFNGIIAGNSQFSNSNKSKAQAKISLLNQVLNAEDNVSNTSLLAMSEATSKTDFDIHHNNKADLIFGVLAT